MNQRNHLKITVQTIYLSNEETTPVEVYFDDFKVTHTKSPVVQVDDYYPFGLTFNSFQRENSTINRWKFQGQEHVDDLGLNWDSFKWRNHQPEIGRFFNVDPLSNKYVYNSPYAFSENNVTAHVELEGLEKVHFNIRPVYNGPIGITHFSSSGDTNGRKESMMITLDLGKQKISDTKCSGNSGNSKGPSLVKNKDGSLTLSAIGNFGNEGHAGFSINITNNIERDGTLSIKSNLVTDNKSPYEVVMRGTEDGEVSDGILLNTASQTLAPIPRGIRKPPSTAEDQANMDIEVYKGNHPDDARIGFVRNSGEEKFVTPTSNDIKKAKKPVVIEP